MHPLQVYLEETGEPLADFAERVLVDSGELEAIMDGRSLPGGQVIQRIIAETSGQLTLFDFFGARRAAPGSRGGMGKPSGEIVDFVQRRARLHDTQLIDPALLHEVLAYVLDMPGIPEQAIATGAEAAANTYLAMARVTSRHGQFRLVQALQPVIEQILEENSASLPDGATAQNIAVQAASLYEQCRLRLAAGRF